ncbi:MAG: DUF2795 domain-containing protein [Syntrophotaleaceae bacterium]
MAKASGGGSPIGVAKYLKGIDCPAGRKDLIEHARKNHAAKAVLEKLEQMPDEEYESMADVMKGYGKEH